MIQANELRIGNIVGRKYFNPNPKNPKQEIEPCYVLGLLDKVRISLDLKGRDVLKCDYDLLEPIPLTEEWLIRFGFEERLGGRFFKYNWFYIEQECAGVIGFYFRSIDGFMAKCQYVHQLQNLYFALTNQELNTKL